MTTIDWSFDDRFVRELPGDPNPHRGSRVVLNAAYSRIDPVPVTAPRLVGWVPEVAALVGLTPEHAAKPEVTQALAGNQVLAGMKPYAACYGGHQFGHWAGQLGDGRAVTLGEAQGPDGQRWDIQLKGAGQTPYSRGADGRAVLRSSIREFLCSEAMHHLGIPTTRALSLCTTGEPILRDMFYDGRAAHEPGAVVCRVAPSFLRFGSFQIFAARQDHETLAALVDFTLRHFFSDETAPLSGDERLLAWLTEVTQRTAELVVEWQRVGFVHGVLNTDNMSILGLTIDYGPYGWLDNYDPDFTPNTTDAERRRYRFSYQPPIGAWNVARLLEAISPLMEEPQALQQVLDGYQTHFGPAFLAMFRRKLGLESTEYEDPTLIDGLLELLAAEETDMTLFFRHLAAVPVHEDASAEERIEALIPAFYNVPSDAHRNQLGSWLQEYAARIRRDSGPPETRRSRMNQTNPHFIPRNYLAQQAIDRALEADFTELDALMGAARRPYDDDLPERLVQKRPDWARHRAGCSMLSCSS